MNVKRRTQDEDEASDSTLKRRKTSTSSSNAPVELSEEDRLLMKLKEEENLPWKDIAARFQTERGKSYQIPALQMRLKRLKERLRVWTDADVTALRKAHDYWRDNKFEIIAQKMVEFGATDKWASKQVARKWAEIDPTATPFMTHDDTPQPFSYTTSPVEAPRMMPFLGMP
ncbi:hypothetical protein K490DRAFT_35633 [Saccharata proteae CBS 121410]|uniref:Myb-like domain-containing protein n=1 Tax=Saccharata proteae CBS 121410 TaxID=1314787 RepID=A0A9P4M1Q1_9PEZI|nr:hypothetical protein K490DRAFT_35633 [Saccharata proteae CBS 121410]